jgi:hypothetical protein
MTKVHLGTRSLILNPCSVNIPPPSAEAIESRIVVWPFNKHHYLLPPLLPPSSMWYTLLMLPFSHSISSQRASVASY